MNIRFWKVEGTANVAATGADTNATSKTPSTLAQVTPRSGALLDGLRSRRAMSALPGIKTVSGAIHSIESARYRAGDKRAGALESRANNIGKLPSDRRRQEFESVLGDLRHVPKGHRFWPLHTLVRQISGARLPGEKQLPTLGRGLPVADRMWAFERVFEQILRMPSAEHDQLLAVLAGQIEGLPEAGRLSAFERIADRIGEPDMARKALAKQLPYVDQGAAQAILARLDARLQREAMRHAKGSSAD